MFGDVPETHKDLALALQQKEIEMGEHTTLSSQYVAQSYVCLAHDWYDIGAEDEGYRLLQKAEQTCPGYFRKYMEVHSKENPDFLRLVNQLFVMLGWQILDGLKDK